MIQNRRRFIKNISTAVLLLNGKTIFATENKLKKKPILRIAIASDIHYGQPKTDFEVMADAVLNQLSFIHREDNFHFGVINGDIVHDDISYFGAIRKKLDQLPFPYYVTQGNHDLATPQEWEQAWNQPINFEKIHGNVVSLFATTSDKKGTYLPPDLDWLEAKFEEHKNAKYMLLFIHIPPIKWTRNAIESAPFVELVKKQKNLRAVFHGHEHDQDGIKWQDGIPYLFDSHVGGNWGTPYRGFRIVELHKDGSIATWIMNPTEKINNADIPVSN